MDYGMELDPLHLYLERLTDLVYHEIPSYFGELLIILPNNGHLCDSHCNPNLLVFLPLCVTL